MNEPAAQPAWCDLRRSPLSLVDQIGTVFFWKDRVLRAIHEAAATEVRALLASGLLETLAERRWAPRCWEAEVVLPGFALVLEQERLPVVSYPYEWTYGMLRDAAARVLEINQLARTFGWELKDCHGFNVVFDGPNPLWVDVGSFVRVDPKALGWPALEEFMRFYEYPLRIWSHGGGFLAMRLVAVAQLMSHADYGLYRWPWLRWGGAGLYERAMQRWYRLRCLARTPAARIHERLGPLVGRLVCGLRARGVVPGNVSLRRLQRRVLRRVRRGARAMWSDYQSTGASSVSTPRFDRIVALLREHRVGSVVELGGNQGWLSERLLAEGVVQSAICTDADEPAVDQGYERARRTGGQMQTAVVNFVVPMIDPNAGDPPEQRFRAEAVLALAVTHHLLLTQLMPVERVLHSIAGYGSRLALVEFMPLGLWNGHEAPPVPDWYTLDWFRTAFTREFKLLHEESLEPNRHLFCGEPLR